MFNVGISYRIGSGVAKDESKAIEWLCRAANNWQECKNITLKYTPNTLLSCSPLFISYTGQGSKRPFINGSPERKPKCYVFSWLTPTPKRGRSNSMVRTGC